MKLFPKGKDHSSCCVWMPESWHDASGVAMDILRLWSFSSFRKKTKTEQCVSLRLSPGERDRERNKGEHFLCYIEKLHVVLLTDSIVLFTFKHAEEKQTENLKQLWLPSRYVLYFWAGMGCRWAFVSWLWDPEPALPQKELCFAVFVQLVEERGKTAQRICKDICAKEGRPQLNAF